VDGNLQQRLHSLDDSSLVVDVTLRWSFFPLLAETSAAAAPGVRFISMTTG